VRQEQGNSSNQALEKAFAPGISHRIDKQLSLSNGGR